MNSVIISGTIKNIVYKLVDRGNIYALIILKLEVEKCKKNIMATVMLFVMFLIPTGEILSLR